MRTEKSQETRDKLEADLRAAFESVAEDTPLWQAIRELLLQEYGEAIDRTGALAGAGEPGVLAASAGAMEALGDFYETLKRNFEAAHQVGPRR